MRVLSIIHHDGSRAGVFAEPFAERGHELVEWNISGGEPLPGPLESFAGAMVFGGVMHPDADADHPWLGEEALLIRRLHDEGVPLLGVCLGGQLVARALGASVRRSPAPEIGWPEVELTPAAASDPLFGDLPERFPSCQWHSYQFELPDGAVALARNSVCLQAFRAGDTAWGLQFHAEVTRESLTDWIAKFEIDDDAARVGFDRERAREGLERHIDRWNEIGRRIAAGFADVTELLAPVRTRDERLPIAKGK